VLDPGAVLADEDLSCSLICGWYYHHVIAGGEPDALIEEPLSEVAEQASEMAALQ
jgi:hypothetical protein